ncbi:CCA tRNA nucleotidyltransferase [Devosia beringensis]|uniref:CCA tRNA nucleotidyltransferase n=1 Tax=Devosia beringensis TaxID=2657486 RepID=UPI00186B8998|nr:CCA tRNA nucleotidyltransferase [Devosia beringensis]
MSAEALKSAEWLVRPETQAILAALDGAEGRTRAVGGVVRDTLLARQRVNPDIDLATELLPEDVMARAKAAGIAVYPTGIDHGTVTLKLGETLAEVTTLRRDIETNGRHAVVAFGTDWREDASRRDFTLNALYCGPDGTLFDPLDGLEDALAGHVRFIGDAAQRISEDGLRVYRFFRFSASHGGQQFDPDGLAACAAAVSRLGHLSRERVGQEITRMLALPKVAMSLLVMAELGLLEFDDVAARALVAYETLGGQSAATRLALLAGDALEAAQESWRLSNEMVGKARDIGRAAALLADDRVGEAAYRHGESAVEGLALVAAREEWVQARLAETARALAGLVVPDFPVSGRDLARLGMKPGPHLGKELARLERAWIDSGFALGKPALLTLVQL